MMLDVQCYLCKKLNVGRITGFGTRDCHLAAYFEPWHGENRAAVGTWKRHDVLFVVVEQAQHGLANEMHAYGQAEEFRLGPRVAVDLNAFVIMFCVESRYLNTIFLSIFSICFFF